MKINKTMINESLNPLADKCNDLFKECYALLINLDKIKPILVNKDKHESENGETEDFEYIQLDELETLLDLNIGKCMDLFVKSAGSRDGATHRRLYYLLPTFKKFKSRVEEVTEAYVPLSVKEIEELHNLCVECLGQLAYFMYYQFAVDIFMECYENDSEELEVDNTMFTFCDKHNIDITKTAVLINRLRIENKALMTVFDEFPELEEPFYDIIGGMVNDYQAFESKLDVEDVRYLIGATNPDVEEFVKSIERR